MKHFKLRHDLMIKTLTGVTLYRIEATRDSKHAKAGDLGGYIEKESNLDDNAWVCGDAWVYGNARVLENARVYGDARVSGNAQVYGDARVSGNAQVYGNARVSGDARVWGNALVYGNAWVLENAQVYGNALVYENARVSGNARVLENAQVYGNALVSGDAQVCGDARVFENAWVSGDAQVYGNAQVSGDARVWGDARVRGDAIVSKYGECIVINNLKHDITCTPNGIFIGCKSWKTIEEFELTYKKIGLIHGLTEVQTEISANFVRTAMYSIQSIKNPTSYSYVSGIRKFFRRIL